VYQLDVSLVSGIVHMFWVGGCNWMEFVMLAAKRRSIRKFKLDPVASGVLGRVLEAGRWAPSAGNCQPWRFVVVTDVEIKGRIAEICTRFSREHWRDFPPERARYLAARGGTWDKSYMKNIPVLIAVCYELVKDMKEELVLASVWMAVENMLLAATAEGLGSCVYTFYSRKEESEVKRILWVPKNYRTACIIQVGYPNIEPPAPYRKKLEETVSYQHF
jgi:nitroreductase